ncbi:thioredoxin, mitochondrial-like [Scleropages formosus]|uniref:Thioredoxin, mitochondrial-like n=1 Tax=Scleropages formosus TaxID=113540 RepID=A0A0P7UF00_SCLFO|nr:thioredoxin, mitochondrial-like [Scleropages formosus]
MHPTLVIGLLPTSVAAAAARGDAVPLSVHDVQASEPLTQPSILGLLRLRGSTFRPRGDAAPLRLPFPSERVQAGGASGKRGRRSLTLSGPCAGWKRPAPESDCASRTGSSASSTRLWQGARWSLPVCFRQCLCACGLRYPLSLFLHMGRQNGSGPPEYGPETPVGGQASGGSREAADAAEETWGAKADMVLFGLVYFIRSTAQPDGIVAAAPRLGRQLHVPVGESLLHSSGRSGGEAHKELFTQATSTAFKMRNKERCWRRRSQSFTSSPMACRHVLRRVWSSSVRDLRRLQASRSPCISASHSVAPRCFLSPSRPLSSTPCRGVSFNVQDTEDFTERVVNSDLPVSAVPTVVAMRGGKVLDQFVGIKDEDQLDSFVDKLVGP